MTDDQGRDLGGPPGERAGGQGDAHADDGLELAKLITRSLRGAAARPARTRTGPGTAASKWTPGRRSGRSQMSGAHPDERDPQMLDTTLDRLVADRGWDVDLRVHGVFGRWPELVGTDIAAHCTPESFADGRLVVRTDSTAWATQLKLLAPNVVRRLNEELGHGTVSVIEVLGPHAPSWKRGRRSMRDGRGPRDTYG